MTEKPLFLHLDGYTQVTLGTGTTLDVGEGDWMVFFDHVEPWDGRDDVNRPQEDAVEPEPVVVVTPEPVAATAEISLGTELPEDLPSLEDLEDEVEGLLSEVMGDDEAPDYSEWTIEDLKAELRVRELRVSGNKPTLMARLAADDAAEA